MKCPGQDMQFWENDAIFDIDCPECGKPVEFYKDDTTRKCGSCGHRFVNPKMDFGCAAYCKFAEQCLGTLPEEFIGSQDNLLKDKVAVEIKRYYKTDFKKISKVVRIARYAEKIGKTEGVNMAILLCTAYLYNIGADTALEKSNSTDPQQVKQESIVTATAILKKIGAKEQLLNEVCTLIEIFDTPAADSSPECNVLADALHMVEIEDKHKTKSLQDSELSSQYHTTAGKLIAKEIFKQIGIVT